MKNLKPFTVREGLKRTWRSGLGVVRLFSPASSAKWESLRKAEDAVAQRIMDSRMVRMGGSTGPW